MKLFSGASGIGRAQLTAFVFAKGIRYRRMHPLDINSRRAKVPMMDAKIILYNHAAIYPLSPAPRTTYKAPLLCQGQSTATGWHLILIPLPWHSPYEPLVSASCRGIIGKLIFCELSLRDPSMKHYNQLREYMLVILAL